MIELPEGQTLAKQLNDTCKGKTIAEVQAAQSPHGFAFYSPDAADYPAVLRGRALEGASAAGGHVALALGEKTLVLNDGVNLRYLEKGQAPPKKHQLYLVFEEGDALVCTVQMYAGLHIYDTAAVDGPYYRVALEKPSPLADAFDEAYFATLVAATPPKLSAKALLATEQRIPGLGNGCLQDILWTAMVNPQTKLQALAPEKMADLYKSVKQTLAAMAGRGGRNTEKDLFGKPGGYDCVLSSKTVAHPCPRCGGGITRKAYMGGNVYFCGNCQKI